MELFSTTSNTSNNNWSGSTESISDMMARAREIIEARKGLPEPDFESIVITREAFEQYFSEHVDIKVPEDATGFESLLYGIPIKFFNTNTTALLEASKEAIGIGKRVLLIVIECGKPDAKVFNGSLLGSWRDQYEKEPMQWPHWMI
jgi:hypothetical protein